MWDRFVEAIRETLSSMAVICSFVVALFFIIYCAGLVRDISWLRVPAFVGLFCIAILYIDEKFEI